ncbi:MAG: glycosyltransferase family 4 protein [Actinomycetota bacterium]
MRILLVNKYAHVTGGADVNCLGLAEVLRRRGHDVALLSTASSRNVWGEGEFIEASVTHASRERLGAAQQVEVARRALWNPSAGAAMRRLIGRFRPQVVHAHKLYPQLSGAPVIAAARAKLPIVQTLHDYEFLAASYVDHRGGWIDRDESKLSFRALNTATYIVRRRLHARKVDAWIANSRYVAARYEERGIASTVLPSFVEPITADPPGFSDRRGAVFVGRLSVEKGVRDVLELAESLPSVEVSVAGHGPLEADVAAAASRLPNLEFAGSVDRAGVFRLLERARVCVMPSHWQEPGGIAALEAMSVGTPVVAYASGGLAEYVGDIGGGRVIEPDALALARECETLHRDQRTWGELSRRGAAGVASKHSPEHYALAVERIYGRLIDEAPASP